MSRATRNAKAAAAANPLDLPASQPLPTDRPIRVLVWGSAQEGPCAFFRGYMYDDALRELGVELRHITKIDFKVDPAFADNPQEAFKQGRIDIDREPFEWSDVLMLRRYYNTAYKCARSSEDDYLNDKGACHFRTTDPREAQAHEHGYRDQDGITRTLWPLLRHGYTGGIVYETDDNHWRIQPWNGYYPDVMLEHDLIDDMARRADILTTSTPALARAYAHLNPRIQVVRNAIDPRLYERRKPRRPHDKPRLVYYGSTARMRDYLGPQMLDRGAAISNGYAYKAVEERKHRLTRVFLGTNPGTEELMSQFWDEQTPYITGIAAFSQALTHSDGDIGIAPLGGDEFDRSKSELHWLEYAMAEQAFIGERFRPQQGDLGPYGVINEGEDGLLASGRQEWADALDRLLDSRDFRDHLVGNAKERVLREYDLRVRAPLWRDVFRFAAEHPGIGLPRSIHPVP